MMWMREKGKEGRRNTSMGRTSSNDQIHRAEAEPKRKNAWTKVMKGRERDRDENVPNNQVQSSRRKSQLRRLVGFFFVKPKNLTNVSFDFTSGAEVCTSHILR